MHQAYVPAARAVDAITSQFNQMNVDADPAGQQRAGDSSHPAMRAAERQQCTAPGADPFSPYMAAQMEAPGDEDQTMLDDCAELMMQDEADAVRSMAAARCGAQQAAAAAAAAQDKSKTLVVTNVDFEVFTSATRQSLFESLFRAFDARAEFRYLRSFRRVRIDFGSASAAERALEGLRELRFGSCVFKCYLVQFIKTRSLSAQHLMLPKMTRQFLISPPASPPEDWEPIHEGPPVIDVQLISAIANLVPGQVHEIHAGTESQPGIYVQVCEDARALEVSPAADAGRADHEPDCHARAGCAQADYELADCYAGGAQHFWPKVRIPPTPRPM